MKGKLTYYAMLNPVRYPGIWKKIDNTISACQQLGLEADAKIHPTSFDGIKSFINDLIREDSKFIYIRFFDFISPLIFFIVLYHRAMGRKVIIDVPTPRTVSIREIDVSDARKSAKIIRKLWTFWSGSWVLWPYNKVVQYAEESPWFSFGCKHKTIKIGNGITIGEETPLAGKDSESNQLHLIAVAQMADWHGYDRLINALALMRDRKHDLNIYLTLVGDGVASPKLKALTKQLNLQNQIHFPGMLTGAQLDQAFSTADIGVASLGLYRIGLHEASVLKTREYMSRGLCVIASGLDPDIPENSPYRFLVPNDNSIEPITSMLSEISNKKLPSTQEVREFAEKHLTWEKKIEKILSTC